MITINLNGAARELAPGATLSDLLASMGLAGKRVAIERNGAIVPRSLHGETRLAPGDVVEIVSAVGGG
ncbi:thiamine biosynthesis protein ThiS [Denitratisoma sp. DHT3]|uniref:sulfur carrier protein ThiS n=1 Tax=Denitratisoma sp. DHT3 TaxID=1981880 RepID=UPI001198833A|nr:sulfur carrier protein ThiS [Denitratisoma sp. DHT3]QDX82408.1 thiamine biosynthesis protein ThiS [Denitratisoma sp. DHT3]